MQVCEDPLEKGMATHSNILAWRIPWTEELGRLQSMGLQSRTPLKRRCPESWELPGALGKFSGGLQGDEAGWPWGSILKEERLSSSKL